MIRQQEIENSNRERMTQWELSRGEFLKSLALLGLSTQLIGCSTSNDEALQTESTITPLLTNQQALTIQTVQAILFPDDGNGPSVEDINAFPFLLWYLQDELIDPFERDFFALGADWLNEEAKDLYQQPFLDLSPTIKHRLIESLAKKKKMKIWFSKLITLIFEALLTHPHYGGNPNEIGWKWLNHNPGSPQSDEAHYYPEILTTIHNEI